MKTAQEIYPDCTEHGGFWAPSNYQPILDQFGEIVLQVDDGDYQGDSRLIYKNGEQYGLLIFGWGSCSGCDSLQACDSYKDIDELMASLQARIKWDTKENLLKYISEKDWEAEYCWHADETRQFVEQAKRLLAEVD
jgi:hypothetical protein